MLFDAIEADVNARIIVNVNVICLSEGFLSNYKVSKKYKLS